MAGEPITPGSVNEAYEKTAATPGVNKFDNAGGRKKKGCSPIVIGSATIGVGAFLVVAAIAFSTALPSVITSKIETGVAVCKNADIEKESYVDAYGDCDECTPYYYRLSMFNATNAKDFLEKGAKLQVKEVGPYAYRRIQKKVDVKLEENGDLVSFKQYTYHTFDQSLSCEGCSDQDLVTSLDVGYFNIMSQSGGEKGFLRKLLTGAPYGLSKTPADIEKDLEENGEQMMRWANGLNSNQPKAWKQVGGTVLTFLVAGPAALTGLDLSGFEYNGIFATRTISEYALGFPSLLAGLGLGANYKKVCVDAKLNEKCANCKGDECFKLWAECKKCKTGAKVVAINKAVTCPQITARMTKAFNKTVAEEFVGSTCGMCESVGICAAPLPGAAESSGLDYSQKAPESANLGEYRQRTGCSDKTQIGVYEMYDGFTTQPYWATLDKKRNPTLAELAAFANYGNCAKPTANMTCSDVIGNDGTSTKPGGASISGFPDKVELRENYMYLIQAKQNITLINTDEVVDDIEGIKLTRFIPPNDLLSATEKNARFGTGFPVDGVQPMAFNVGFYAYLSYPAFLYGDKSLTEGVDIMLYDGVKASPETMFENGKLKKEYFERYQTYVDVEAGTGKAMRARKRLMASYALAESQFSKGLPMSDLVWPKLKKEVIMPAYIGEEMATITKSKISTYKGIKGLLGSLLPVLIAGIVIGVALIGGGFIYRRRAVNNSRAKGPAGDAI